MKHLLQSACLLLAGIAFGWWLHDSTGTHSKEQTPVASPDTQFTIRSSTDGPGYTSTDEADSMALSSPIGMPNIHRLRQLLNQHKFDQALVYYEQALLLDDGYQQLLKPVVETYLQACLQHCGDGVFVDLVNLWLGTYYQDIPVLLLLAENQRLYGLPEEAASTLQLAATYALQAGQQEDVSNAVQRLVKSTHEALSRQQSWIELLGFYEFLETIDLGTPAFRLQQALLYQTVDELQRSRELLLALQENDNRLDPEWTATLDTHLAHSKPGSGTDDAPMYAIPITRRGEHFLVASSINGGDQVNLVIDTGASMTTLSRANFMQIKDSGFTYQGTRLFNTANGLTQGEIYRVASISMGDARVDNLDIAVLDYEPSAGVDGLLGMNVLRNYRFEIDQDRELLYLRPRQ